MPPRGAAVAGIIFSILLIVGLGLARYTVPADPSLPGIWLTDPGRRKAVQLALDLVPFAGIAFLWFIGVLRNRLGELEDQFFATVFLASGLLFVACLFAAAAVMGALIESVAAGNIDSETYYFGRRVGDALMNLFAIKMAGVFMISTCTIALRTAIFPALGGVLRLCVCLTAAGGNRQLEVDHTGLPDVDVLSQNLNSEILVMQPAQH